LRSTRRTGSERGNDQERTGDEQRHLADTF
jgi:hypothetical protein